MHSDSKPLQQSFSLSQARLSDRPQRVQSQTWRARPQTQRRAQRRGTGSLTTAIQKGAERFTTAINKGAIQTLNNNMMIKGMANIKFYRNGQII